MAASRLHRLKRPQLPAREIRQLVQQASDTADKRTAKRLQPPRVSTFEPLGYSIVQLASARGHLDPVHPMVCAVADSRYDPFRFEGRDGTAGISLVERQFFCELKHGQALIVHQEVQRIALGDRDS